MFVPLHRSASWPPPTCAAAARGGAAPRGLARRSVLGGRRIVLRPDDVGGVGGIIDAWRADLSLEGALSEANRARAAAEAAAAAVVTDAEAGWLAERIGRDGAVTPNEKALLAFIGEDGPRLHPKLAALAARAA